MNLEIFSICDAATDYGGRLNILGAFEGIAGISLPVVRDRCSVVVRMRFSDAEGGDHEVAVKVVNGKGILAAPEMKAKFAVNAVNSLKSVGVNLVLNINQLKFSEFGEYAIQLFVDGQVKASLPLMIAREVRGRRPGMDN